MVKEKNKIMSQLVNHEKLLSFMDGLPIKSKFNFYIYMSLDYPDEIPCMVDMTKNTSSQELKDFFINYPEYLAGNMGYFISKTKSKEGCFRISMFRDSKFYLGVVE